MRRVQEEIEAGEEEFLDAVIEETLRLRPVVPFTGRDLKQNATLAGYDLPAETTVLAAIYLAHTNPATFPDPYAFRPERFLEGSPDTFSWIPFGGGTRRCIGAAFAQLEMRVVLRTVLSGVELRSAGEGPQRMVRRNVTLSPIDGTPAVLERRVPVAVG
jgi:cytochrome P450